MDGRACQIAVVLASQFIIGAILPIPDIDKVEKRVPTGKTASKVFDLRGGVDNACTNASIGKPFQVCKDVGNHFNPGRQIWRYRVEVVVDCLLE